MPEVARHEPAAALDGGPDGLAAYRGLLPDLPRLLDRDGVAVMEVGAGQAEAVASIAQRAALVCSRRNDLSGVPRALLLRPVAASKKPFGRA